MKWNKTSEKPYPKDGSLFIARTLFLHEKNIYLLRCNDYGKHKFISCVCGCMNAEDCIIGDIIEWIEIEEDGWTS